MSETPWDPYQADIASASANTGIPVSILDAVLTTESNGNPNAISYAGAQGLMQVMPANDLSLNITNPYSPSQNINGGATLLAQLFQKTGNWTTALEEYNGGGNGPSYSTSQNYAANVLNLATAIGGGVSPSGANITGNSTVAGGASTAGTPQSGTATGSTILSLFTGQNSLIDAAFIVLGIIVVIFGLYMFAKNEGLVPETIPVPVPV